MCERKASDASEKSRRARRRTSHRQHPVAGKSRRKAKDHPPTSARVHGRNYIIFPHQAIAIHQRPLPPRASPAATASGSTTRYSHPPPRSSAVNPPNPPRAWRERKDMRVTYRYPALPCADSQGMKDLCLRQSPRIPFEIYGYRPITTKSPQSAQDIAQVRNAHAFKACKRLKPFVLHAETV